MEKENENIAMYIRGRRRRRCCCFLLRFFYIRFKRHQAWKWRPCFVHCIRIVSSAETRQLHVLAILTANDLKCGLCLWRRIGTM